MKNMKSILFILAMANMLYAQQLHQAAEMIKIMEDSKLSYEIVLEEKGPGERDRSNLVLLHNMYQKKEGDRFVVKHIEPNAQAQAMMAEAEKLFQSGNIKRARDFYEKAFEADSTCLDALTYVGQTYEHEHNFNEALRWYQKAVKLNYIDYMSHWFMADIYREQGELQKALDEITIARILNRNNPRLAQSYTAIYQMNDLKTDDWYFNAQIDIDSLNPKTIRVAATKEWFGYAIAKAIWWYEPGYAEKMGSAPGEFSMLMEKEGLIGLLTTLDANKKAAKQPAFKALRAALESEQVDEYILYEILLPDHPEVARQLSPEVIAAIKDYVIGIRGGRK